MELLKAQRLCIELMEKHGLAKTQGWKFQFTNSTHTAGICRYKSRKSFFGPTTYSDGGIIGLSKTITQLHSDEEVLDTILHEIAHGLTKGHDHDGVWVRRAIEIGCNGKRCYKAEGEVKELHDKLRDAKSKFVSTCPLCSHEFKMTKLPKNTQWCKCVKKRRGFLDQSCKLVWKPIEGKVLITIPLPVATLKIPIAASRGFNQYVTAAQNPSNQTTSFPNSLLSQQPDSYKSMLDKFEKEFLPIINNNVATFDKIAFKAVRNSTSWRTMNREVRKACDQHCADLDIMSHKEFQARFFYEGVMIGRTTWGKNAPWQFRN